MKRHSSHVKYVVTRTYFTGMFSYETCVHYQQTPPALKIRPYSAARRILYSQVHVPNYEIRNF